MITTSHDSFTLTPRPDADVGGQRMRLVRSRAPVNTIADGIAVISHELRNSLGVVRNAAMLLRAHAGAEGVERARVLIERHVVQMNRHIEHLLDPAVLSQPRRALRLSYVDLRTILQNSVDAIAPDCARRGHRLLVQPARRGDVGAGGRRLASSRCS